MRYCQKFHVNRICKTIYSTFIILVCKKVGSIKVKPISLVTGCVQDSLKSFFLDDLGRYQIRQ